MRSRLLVFWGALLVVGLTLLGCDFFTNQSTTPGTTGFVYVLNSAQGAGGVGSISGYQANASSGVLLSLVNSPFGTGSLPSPTSMSADALGRFVYVSTSGGLVGFIISQNTSTLGQLSCTVTAACAATVTQAVPTAIAVDPSARAVYAVETSSTSAPQVEGFAINASTGELTAQADSPYSLVPPEASGVSPTSATVAASGGFLFVGMNNGDIVSVPINADGTLNIAAVSKVAPLTGVTNVAALTADPTVSLLYAADGTQFVSLYGINRSTGALTGVNKFSVSSSSPVGVGVASVNGTPTFVYTANQGSSNVSGFVIQSGGSLLILAGSPFSVSGDTTPVALAVDPSQLFLYVAYKGSNSVLSFVIVSGNLEPPSTSNPAAGEAPIAVVAVP